MNLRWSCGALTFWIALLHGCAHVELPQRGAARGAASVDATFGESVDSIVDAAFRKAPLAGVSVAVSRKGKVVHVRGYGKANLERDEPATDHTVYRIGSITKQFTAVAMLQLAEQGRIVFDDGLEKFLPDFPLQAHKVTIRHLLTHTSGIKDYTELGSKFTSSRELFELLRDKPFDFEPGTKWKYDNSGYYLLGLVIEKLSGERYLEYMRKHVFEPLALSDTSYCGHEAYLARGAQGYTPKDKQLARANPILVHQPFSAGGLCSSVADLLSWQRALEGGRVLSPTSLRSMRTPFQLLDGKSSNYGFGVFIETFGETNQPRASRTGPRRMIDHGGGIEGFVSDLRTFPDDDLTIAVLANTEGNAADEIAAAIAPLAFDGRPIR